MEETNSLMTTREETNSLMTTREESKGIAFKILTYNVNQARKEEKCEETKWGNRKDRVVALVKHTGAEIVCLQELRNLEGYEGVQQFLASSFPQYEGWYDRRNASTIAFGQAILWDPRRFYPMKYEKWWLSDTPEEISDSWSKDAQETKDLGFTMTAIKFCCVSEEGKRIVNKPSFWVFNTQFPVEEDFKTKACEWISKCIHDLAENDPFVLAGDFNLFPDLNAEEQRSTFTKHLKDLGKDACSSQKKRKLEGTFVGYERDPFKANLKNMVSRLDHVFGSDRVNASLPTLYTETMLPEEPEELTTRSTPSDHLALGMHIKIE